MSQPRWGRLGRACITVLACSCGHMAAAWAAEAPPTRAVLDPSLAWFDASREVLGGAQEYRFGDLGTGTALAGDRRVGRSSRAHLDLSPVLDEIFGFFHRHGVPLQEQRDEHGRGPVGVYADFGVGRDTPAISFHLGDRPREPLGAFYSNERGFRCAVVWPVARFTLRLEGGEDSELGYYGIAGIQWLDPRRPLAIGIGLPLNLRDTARGAGVVVQLRMTLD
jgi:hypothetical protein